MFGNVDPDDFDFSTPGGPVEIAPEMKIVAARLWGLYASLVEMGFNEQQAYGIVITVVQAEVQSA